MRHTDRTNEVTIVTRYNERKCSLHEDDGKLVREADKLQNASIQIGRLSVSCSFDWLTKVKQIYEP